MTSPIKVNPELDRLRKKALESVNGIADEEIDNLISSTVRIHAGFLFHSPKTLQPLLRAINETNSSATESSWQSFGNKLGLDIQILKVINNNQFNHEDPVYNTLLSFVQYEDATISRIIEALRDIGRLDVIMRSKESFLELAKTILNHEQELMRLSHSSVINGSIEGNEMELSNDVLIKPAVIPDAPFIIKNVLATPLMSTLLLQNFTISRTNVICSPTFSQALQSESYLQSSPASPAMVSDSTPKTPYTRKVLLTFASDGAEIASEVAQILREPRGTCRIGVLMLGEQTRHLEQDPNLFITASFQQVDYVIPIITEEYLRTVMRRKHVSLSMNEVIDALYVPFVYQLMTQDYIRRQCLNDKVRCLIPDQKLDKILDHLLMAGPLFLAWEKTSRTHQLAERILAEQT